jgi:hypothetical protein
MAHQAEQVSATGLVDTKPQPGPRKRRQYSEALKRQVVAETQAPGASVAFSDVGGLCIASPEKREKLIIDLPQRYSVFFAG